MMSGFGIDQTYGETGAPLCISIFSAPNYPMGSTARGNLGAFLRFDGPRLRSPAATAGSHVSSDTVLAGRSSPRSNNSGR